MAGILGTLFVIAGAFGAHALKSRISAEAFEIFEIKNFFHMMKVD